MSNKNLARLISELKRCLKELDEMGLDLPAIHLNSAIEFLAEVQSDSPKHAQHKLEQND